MHAIINLVLEKTPVLDLKIYSPDLWPWLKHRRHRDGCIKTFTFPKLWRTVMVFVSTFTSWWWEGFTEKPAWLLRLGVHKLIETTSAGQRFLLQSQSLWPLSAPCLCFSQFHLTQSFRPCPHLLFLFLLERGGEPSVLGRLRIARWSLWAGVDQLYKEGLRGYRQCNCIASDNWPITPSRVKGFRLMLAEGALCITWGGRARRICHSPPLQPLITLLSEDRRCPVSSERPWYILYQ